MYFYEDFINAWQQIIRIDDTIPAPKLVKRNDYCYDCDTDVGYWHAMTFKCGSCDKILLGASKR